MSRSTPTLEHNPTDPLGLDTRDVAVPPTEQQSSAPQLIEAHANSLVPVDETALDRADDPQVLDVAVSCSPSNTLNGAEDSEPSLSTPGSTSDRASLGAADDSAAAAQNQPAGITSVSLPVPELAEYQDLMQYMVLNPTTGGEASSDPGVVMKCLRLLLTQAQPEVTEPALRRHEEYLYSLWLLFTSRIAHFLTPLGVHAENPFNKYLSRDGERNPGIMIAVLYLSHVIDRRRHLDTLDQEEPGCLQSMADRRLQQLEHDFESSQDPHATAADRTDTTMQFFTTVVVFCMAFVANQDAEKLLYWMEFASALCQVLFKTRAEDESFLYLANMLGYIQTSLLFSTHAANVNAPDYLGAALEFHKLNNFHSDLLYSIDGWCLEHNHFRDLDMFSGMSASLASLLHTLGTLLKKKAAGLHEMHEGQFEWVRAFESEVDGLENRLRRHITFISKSQQRTSLPPTEGTTLTECLRHYNEALLWCAWNIFSIDLKNDQVLDNIEIEVSAERILDACAQVPRASTTAPLLLFPLVIGGLKATKAVYQEFVISRLECLENIGLTDTGGLCIELKNRWALNTSTTRPPFTSQLLI